MSWPLVSDFSRMLQNPKIAFRDPLLKECTVERNNLGQPKPRSGNFATVYRGYRPDGTEFAIRTFNRAADQRRERYQAVSNYLRARSIWSIVSFTFDEKGIRASDGKLYPLLTMDWVPGVTLFEWSRDRSREGYQEALRIGADVWLQLVRQLTANGIVHGDLQHGNVMVSPEGHFKLVDYDCLSVPDLMGQRNLETGMVPYQHPARNAETSLFPGLDNFSALVIYTALRALAAAPSLWFTYVDRTGYDRLLFRKEDFDSSHTSPLYQDLMHSPDQQVRDLTHYLFQLTRYDLHQIPPIDEVLLWCNSIEDLLAKRDWDTAVKLVQRMGTGEQIPHNLRGQVEEAQRRVACRQALEAAIERGNEEEIQRFYVPELLDDYPAAAHLVEKARSAVQVRQILDYLDAAKRSQNWDAFRKTWQTYQGLLADRPSAQPYKEEIIKLLRVDTVRRLLADRAADDRAVLDAWNHLEALGGHPTAEPFRAEIQRRTARHGNISRLRELVQQQPKTPTIAFDKEVVAACTPDVLKQFPRLRAPLEASQKRLGRLNRLLELTNTCTLDSEQEIVTAGRHLPQSYHPALHRRIQQARQRMKALELLRESLEEPYSDLRIVAAWRTLEKLTGQNLLPEGDRWRVLLASERVPLIKALQLLDDTLPPDEMDRRVLRIWKESLLNSASDAAPWLHPYEEAKARRELLRQIEAAIANTDQRTIERLIDDPRLSGYPLPDTIRRGIDEVRRQTEENRRATGQHIVAALQENRRSAFAELFDTDAIRELCVQYPHHQPAIARWTETEILPQQRCGLSIDPQGGIEEVDKNHVQVKWIWPPPSISNRCVLTVCRERPGPYTLPSDVPALYTATLERAQWEAAGGLHQFEVTPEFNDAHVVVWAVVDLGFEVFHSQPLVLGQLHLGRKHRLWGLFG